MATVDGVELPAYFEHYDTPVKLVATPDGGHAAWKLDRSTGVGGRRTSSSTT